MIDTTAQKAKVEAKLAHAEAQYASNASAQAVGYSPAPESLAEQIGRQLLYAKENMSDLRRAHDITLRHPEFDELLWLLRSGLV